MNLSIKDLLSKWVGYIISNWKILLGLIILVVIILSAYRKPELTLQYLTELKWPLLIFTVPLLFGEDIIYFLNKISSLNVKFPWGEMEVKMEEQRKEIKLAETGVVNYESNMPTDSLSDCQKELEFERLYNRILGLQFNLLQSLTKADRYIYSDVYHWYEKIKNEYPAFKNLNITDLLMYLNIKNLIEIKTEGGLLSQKIALTTYGKDFVNYISSQYSSQLSPT